MSEFDNIDVSEDDYAEDAADLDAQSGSADADISASLTTSESTEQAWSFTYEDEFGQTQVSHVGAQDPNFISPVLQKYVPKKQILPGTAWQQEAIKEGYSAQEIEEYAHAQFTELSLAAPKEGRTQEEVTRYIKDRYGFTFDSLPETDFITERIWEELTNPNKNSELWEAKRRYELGEKTKEAEQKFGQLLAQMPELSSDIYNSLQNTKYRLQQQFFDLEMESPWAPDDRTWARKFYDGMAQGISQSTSGLFFGLKPKAPVHDMGVWGEVGMMLAQAAGDLPTQILGYMGGQAAWAATAPGYAKVFAPLAGAANAIAFTEATREYYMIALEMEAGTNFESLAEQAMRIGNKYAQGAVLGAAAGYVGGKLMPFAAQGGNFIQHELAKVGQSKFGYVLGSMWKHGLTIPPEAALVTGLQGFFDWRMPEKKDFLYAGALIGGLRLSGFYTGKLTKAFKDHGLLPFTTIEVKDPQLAADLASLNIPIGKHTVSAWRIRRPETPNISQAIRDQQSSMKMTLEEYFVERMSNMFNYSKSMHRYLKQRFAESMFAEGATQDGPAFTALQKAALEVDHAEFGSVHSGKYVPEKYSEWIASIIDQYKEAGERAKGKLLDVDLGPVKSLGYEIEGTGTQRKAKVVVKEEEGFVERRAPIDEKIKRTLLTMAAQWESIQREYYDLMDGRRHLATPNPIPKEGRKLIARNTASWSHRGKAAAEKVAKNANEQNRKASEAAGRGWSESQEHKAEEVHYDANATVYRIRNKAAARDLIKRFIEYMDQGKEKGEESWGKEWGKGIEEQTERIFKQLPQEFVDFVRSGKGNPKNRFIAPPLSEHGKALQAKAKDLAKQLQDEQAKIEAKYISADQREGAKQLAGARARLAVLEKDANKGVNRIKNYVNNIKKELADLLPGTKEFDAKQLELQRATILLAKEEAIRDGQYTEKPMVEAEAARIAEAKTRIKDISKTKREIQAWEEDLNTLLKLEPRDVDKLNKIRTDLHDTQVLLAKERNSALRKQLELDADVESPITNKDGMIDVLSYGDSIAVLNPHVEKTQAQVDMERLTVEEAGARVRKALSVGKTGKIRKSILSGAYYTYALFNDRLIALNRPAKFGWQTVPYLAARLYAGVDGIARHIIEKARVLPQNRSVFSATQGQDRPVQPGKTLKEMLTDAQISEARLKSAVSMSKSAQAISEKLGEAREDFLQKLRQNAHTILDGVDITARDVETKSLSEWVDDAVNLMLGHKDTRRADALNKMFSNVDDPLHNFRIYAAAKQMLEALDNGKDMGVARNVLEHIAHNETLNTYFEPALKQLKTWQDYLVDYKYKAGMLTKEKAEELKKQSQYYVPLEQIESTGLTGDNAPIFDPIERMVFDTFSTIRDAEKNMVLRLIADEFSTFDPSTQDVRTLFDWAHFKQEEQNIKGNKSIEYWKDGELVKAHVSPDVYKAAGQIEPAHAQIYAGVLHNLAIGMSTLLRATTTLHPVFIVKNPIRDSFDAFINSNSGYNPFIDIIDGMKAIVSERTQGALFPEMHDIAMAYLRSGASHSHFLGQSRRPMQETLARIVRPKPWLDRLSKQQKLALEQAQNEARKAYERDKQTNFNALREEVERLYPNESKFEQNRIFEEMKPTDALQLLSPGMIKLVQEGLRPPNSIPFSEYGIRTIQELLNPKHFMNNLAELSSFTEESTRMAEFIRAKKSGVSDSEAAFRARENTIDFSRTGSVMKSLNSMITFFNASVQGPDRFFRQMIAQPIETLGRVTSGIIIPTVVLAMVNNEFIAQNPDHPDAIKLRERPDWFRQSWWSIRVPGIGIFNIPKPWEFAAIFANTLEDFFEYAYENNPHLSWLQMMNDNGTFRHMFSELAFGTGSGIQALAPLRDVWTNYNSLTGQPIIPDYMTEWDARMIYYRNTPEIYKQMTALFDKLSPSKQWFGNKLTTSMSPIALEYLVKGYLGTIGADMMSLLSRGLGKVGLVEDRSESWSDLSDIPGIRSFMLRHPGMGARSIQKFYKAVAEIEGQKNALSRALKEESEFANHMQEEYLKDTESLVMVGALKQLVSYRETLYKISTQIRAVHYNKELTSVEKQEMIDELASHAIMVARAGNDAIKELKREAREMQQEGAD